MKQFILSREPDKDNLVRLDGGDYRYLVRVRRLAVGEYFPAILPNGEEVQVKILSIQNKTLTGELHENNLLQRHIEPTVRGTEEELGRGVSRETEILLPPIILFQALPKADKMDLIVRQAAEGGITEIVPFVSDYSANTGKKRGMVSAQKFSRWERIIKEARQQSGSKIATGIRKPVTRDELFEYWGRIKRDNAGKALGVLFHHLREEPPCKGLEKESLHSYLNNVVQNDVVAIAIGPEGGFSDTEVTLFLENGFKPITIGDTILRTETAALYCAAAIRILLLERESWKLK